jgi:hypothetical protein
MMRRLGIILNVGGGNDSIWKETGGTVFWERMKQVEAEAVYRGYSAGNEAQRR